MSVKYTIRKWRLKLLTSFIANNVWEEWYNNAKRAYDIAGAKIDRKAYGDRNSEYGWEIDHEFPVSRGGSRKMKNWRPLHWRNIEAKGDKFDGQWQPAEFDTRLHSGKW